MRKSSHTTAEEQGFNHINNRVWIDGEIWYCDATAFTGEISGEMVKGLDYVEDYYASGDNYLYMEARFKYGTTWDYEDIKELF
ncbi:MAG: hypothetical protein IJ125_02735 [Atopobiaceae bacterium]|nr:hypothetical protein [Atopobiaceae bacterium]